MHSYSPFPRPRPSSSQASASRWIPGLISRLSWVASPVASSHEEPAGRHSIYSRFRRQLPCENGFGGGGPAFNDLWA